MDAKAEIGVIKGQAVDNEGLAALFASIETVAIVGLSPDPSKASFGVAQYLQSYYRIIPVNPNYSEILGEPCYPDLKSVPVPIDLVDVFQRSERIPRLIPDVIAVRPVCFWMQLGIAHRESAVYLLDAGVAVVEDRCTKIDHQRLMGSGQL